MPSRNRGNDGKPMKIGVIDFFAGCGGTSYGFAHANVRGAHVNVIAGIDIDEHSCATYSRMLKRPALPLDITKLVEDKKSFAKLISSWHLDDYDRVILVGCAPCQGFAAHRKSMKGKDHRRSLFGVFAELATVIKPDAIFMENVPDIFSKRFWPYYSAGKSVLESAGYHVRSRIFNFADFGLPQERFRAVMMGFRNSFPMPDPIYDHLNHATVRETIGRLPRLSAGESHKRDPMHIVSKHRPETIKTIKQVPLNGGNRPIGVGPACLDRAREAHGGFTDVYGRLAWDKPAVTITARCRTPSCGRFIHPEQHRGLSIREAALLQGFPPDYVFEGPFDDKYKQVGNAVPPLVAKHMAHHMISILQGKGSKKIAHINGYEHDVIGPVGPGFAVTINGIKKKRAKESRNERGSNVAKV